MKQRGSKIGGSHRLMAGDGVPMTFHMLTRQRTCHWRGHCRVVVAQTLRMLKKACGCGWLGAPVWLVESGFGTTRQMV